jgi:hypothetical protein
VLRSAASEKHLRKAVASKHYRWKREAASRWTPETLLMLRLHNTSGVYWAKGFGGKRLKDIRWYQGFALLLFATSRKFCRSSGVKGKNQQSYKRLSRVKGLPLYQRTNSRTVKALIVRLQQARRFFGSCNLSARKCAVDEIASMIMTIGTSNSQCAAVSDPISWFGEGQIPCIPSHPFHIAAAFPLSVLHSAWV